jgi:hypothetical protein
MKKFFIFIALLSTFTLAGCLGGSSSSPTISGMSTPSYLK